MSRFAIALLALACTLPAGAQDFKEFSTQGLGRSRGVVVRVTHPSGWKQVPLDDDMAVAELRGPHGRLTGILQIGRGRQRDDMEAMCEPTRAPTMLQGLVAQEPDVRVTDVIARKHGDLRAFDVRYERNTAPDFLLVRSVIVCTKTNRVVVSCGASGGPKAALKDIEPVCSQVLGSLSVSDE